MSKENDAKAKARELNQLAGYNRFSVIATPSPVHQGNTVVNSYSVHDSMTGENYVFGSIYGTGALISLTNQLKKQRSDAASSASLKAKKSIRHDVFDEYDENSDEVLEHYGVLGMKWGVRKDPQRAYERANKKLAKLDERVKRSKSKILRTQEKTLRKQERANDALVFKKYRAKRAAKSTRKLGETYIRAQKRTARAKKWYDAMSDAFKDVSIDQLKTNADYVKLGEKYANMTVDKMMNDAASAASLMQLASYYQNKARK